MKFNRLWGMRCYLVGAMDRVSDCGVQWRENITPFLEKTLGVVVLNPCDKPIDVGHEDIEDRNRRKELKKSLRWDEFAQEIKTLRVVDLRMVDMSDFLIVNIDTDVHACGTYEELTWANRCKNPVLIHCEQGKVGCPDWLFGVIPHTHIFDTWSELKAYLEHVNGDENVDTMKRWMFFDHNKMMPKISFAGEK